MSPRGPKYHLSASNEIEWHSVSRGAVSENDSNNGLFLVEHNGRAFFATRKTLEDHVFGSMACAPSSGMLSMVGISNENPDTECMTILRLPLECSGLMLT